MSDITNRRESPLSHLKMRCSDCGTRNQYKMREQVRKYEGDGYNFAMKVTVPFCKMCGSLIVCEEIEEKITKQAHEKIVDSRKNHHIS